MNDDLGSDRIIGTPSVMRRWTPRLLRVNGCIMLSGCPAVQSCEPSKKGMTRSSKYYKLNGMQVKHLARLCRCRTNFLPWRCGVARSHTCFHTYGIAPDFVSYTGSLTAGCVANMLNHDWYWNYGRYHPASHSMVKCAYFRLSAISSCATHPAKRRAKVHLGLDRLSVGKKTRHMYIHIANS